MSRLRAARGSRAAARCRRRRHARRRPGTGLRGRLRAWCGPGSRGLTPSGRRARARAAPSRRSEVPPRPPRCTLRGVVERADRAEAVDRRDAHLVVQQASETPPCFPRPAGRARRASRACGRRGRRRGVGRESAVVGADEAHAVVDADAPTRSNATRGRRWSPRGRRRRPRRGRDRVLDLAGVEPGHVRRHAGPGAVDVAPIRCASRTSAISAAAVAGSVPAAPAGRTRSASATCRPCGRSRSRRTRDRTRSTATRRRRASAPACAARRCGPPRPGRSAARRLRADRRVAAQSFRACRAAEARHLRARHRAEHNHNHVTGDSIAMKPDRGTPCRGRVEIENAAAARALGRCDQVQAVRRGTAPARPRTRRRAPPIRPAAAPRGRRPRRRR